MSSRRRARGPQPQPFIILTAGRSGSTLLLDLLGSHPDIAVPRNEPLSHKTKDVDVLARRTDAVLAAAAAHAAAAGAAAWGWSLHPQHFVSQGIADPAAWCQQRHEDGTRFITLIRSDHVASGLSAILAEATGTWHLTNDGGEPPLVRVDPLEVLDQAMRLEQASLEVARIVGDLSHLELFYELDLADAGQHQATADLVLRHLGLAPHAVVTGLRRPAAALADRIENYEELEAVLADLGHPLAPH